MDHHSGYLEIILGPMFSGKTTKLMETYHLYNSRYGKKVIILGHNIDDRYDKYQITSHDRRELLDCYKCKTIDEFIEKHPQDIDKCDVLLIDECQFFSDIENVIKIVNRGKQVFIFGLDGDANQKLFGNTYKLIPLCDKIIKLNGRCNDCGIENGSIISVCNKNFEQKGQIDVGGDDKYHSLCRKCS